MQTIMIIYVSDKKKSFIASVLLLNVTLLCWDKVTCLKYYLGWVGRHLDQKIGDGTWSENNFLKLLI